MCKHDSLMRRLLFSPRALGWRRMITWLTLAAKKVETEADALLIG